MTEKSYFWDGTIQGDAKLSPYDRQSYTSILNLESSVDQGYVIPAYENSLAVTGDFGSQGVRIDTGAAIIKGYIYYNSAAFNLFTHINQTEYPRFDRVVLRLDYATSAVTVNILTGVPATTPTLPECRDIPGVLFEAPLAFYVMLPGIANIPTTNIIDERKFYNTPIHAATYPLQNIMPNSEFMGFSNPGSAPDMWTLSNTPVIFDAPKSDLSARGRCVRITGTQNDGMTVTLDTGTISTVYTLTFPIKVISGICGVTFGGVTKYVYPSDTEIVFTLRVATNGYQALTIFGNTVGVGANNIVIGQVTLTQGYINSPFVPKHETVFFNTVRPDLGFNGVLKSTATAEYTNFWYGLRLFLPGITGFVTSVQIYDSGSSGAGPYYVSIQDPDTNADLLRVDCAGLPNSTPQSNVGIIQMKFDPTQIESNLYTYQIAVVASGASTMYVYIAVFGIVI